MNNEEKILHLLEKQGEMIGQMNGRLERVEAAQIEQGQRLERLEAAMAKIRRKYGHKSIGYGGPKSDV